MTDSKFDALVADLRGLADEWVNGPGLALEWNVPIGETFAKSVRAVLDKHTGQADSKKCNATESGGYKCERLDPHGDNGHWISNETIRTRLPHSGVYFIDGQEPTDTES